MSRLAARLKARLEREGIALPPFVRIVRTCAGRHQRAAGAWSWFLADADNTPLPVGSPDTAGECAKATNTLSLLYSHDDICVCVENRHESE